MSNVYNPTVKKINNITKVINQDDITELNFTIAVPLTTTIINKEDPRYFEIIKFNGDGSANILVSFNDQAWMKIPNNALLSDLFGDRIKYAGSVFAKKEFESDPDVQVYVAYA